MFRQMLLINGHTCTFFSQRPYLLIVCITLWSRWITVLPLIFVTVSCSQTKFYCNKTPCRIWRRGMVWKESKGISYLAISLRVCLSRSATWNQITKAMLKTEGHRIQTSFGLASNPKYSMHLTEGVRQSHLRFFITEILRIDVFYATPSLRCPVYLISY
jgi:hypothetical protein